MPRKKEPDRKQRRVRLLENLLRVGERLPGAHLLRVQADAIEARALKILRQRLDETAPEKVGGSSQMKRKARPEDECRQETPPGTLLQQLIERSLNMNPDQAEAEFQRNVLAQLVPDEARILAAISDGGTLVFCHVDATSRLGTSSERMLSYASRIGNEAGVILIDNIPHYLNHLSALGLLKLGPEDKARITEYEMIESGSSVRTLCARIEDEMNMKPRLSRWSAGLSHLGLALWQTQQLAESNQVNAQRRWVR